MFLAFPVKSYLTVLSLVIIGGIVPFVLQAFRNFDPDSIFMVLTFISGSSGEADTSVSLRQMAVYIANLFYLTSEALQIH